MGNCFHLAIPLLLCWTRSQDRIRVYWAMLCVSIVRLLLRWRDYRKNDGGNQRILHRRHSSETVAGPTSVDAAWRFGWQSHRGEVWREGEYRPGINATSCVGVNLGRDGDRDDIIRFCCLCSCIHNIIAGKQCVGMYSIKRKIRVQILFQNL